MSQEPELPDCVHGYSTRASRRLLDQAKTLADLLLSDTAYPPGASVLEAGCGIGAQTVTLARQSPEAEIVAIDVARDSLAEAKRKVEAHMHTPHHRKQHSEIRPNGIVSIDSRVT